MEKEVYTTSTLALAAYLITKGFQLKQSHWIDGRLNFAFTPSTELHKSVDDYFKNRKVPVLSFVNANRELKTLVHKAR